MTNSEIHNSIVDKFRGYMQRAAVHSMLFGSSVRPLYADLEGKASKYRGSYVRSHNNMVSKLSEMGYTVSRITEHRGKVWISISNAGMFGF